MSQRSQVANSGSRPIEACSAACAAPPRSMPAAVSASAWSGGYGPPHRPGQQVAGRQVERRLAERRAGAVAPPGEADHLAGHLDVAEADLGLAPGHLPQFAAHLDLGHVPGGGGVAGLARLHQRHPVVQVQRPHQVAVALVHVDGALVHDQVGRGLVHRADQPARRLLHHPDRRQAGAAQAGRGGRVPAHAVPARRAAAQPSRPGEVIDHRPGRRAEDVQVRLGQGQFGGRRAQVRRQHVRVVRVQHGGLHRVPQQDLRMADQVGVQRVVAGDQDRRRRPAAAPGPARPAATARPRCPATRRSAPRPGR